MSSWRMFSVLCLFFFQAEDGIRDIGVTGVQTCALPIFQNDKLRQEIINLKEDGEKLESLDMLKKSLNYVSGDSRNQLVSASIIGKNDGDWYKSFIIDAGSDSGIEKNSIVINEKGVVGIVYSVSNRYSKAISLVDSRASVSFKVPGEGDKNGVITTSSMLGNSDLTEDRKS